MKLTKVRAMTAVFAGVTIVLAACTAVSQPIAQPTIPPTTAPENQPTEQPLMADLPDLGQAPEILNEVWINTEAPVTLAASRGKVVLLEFWTFG